MDCVQEIDAKIVFDLRDKVSESVGLLTLSLRSTVDVPSEYDKEGVRRLLLWDRDGDKTLRLNDCETVASRVADRDFVEFLQLRVTVSDSAEFVRLAVRVTVALIEERTEDE